MQFLKQSTVTALILGAFIGAAVDRYWLWQSDLVSMLAEDETALEHADKHLDPDYVCPMHSNVVSKQAGSCPVCGMDLVKRVPAAITEKTAGGLAEVKVSAEFIHNFGVRTEKVTRGPVSRQIMALGRVSRMPLPKVTNVSSALKGKIISTSHKVIGDTVKKGELLYSIDSAEWRELQQSYIDALSERGQRRSKQLQQPLAMKPKTITLEQLVDSGRVEQATANVISEQNQPRSKQLKQRLRVLGMNAKRLEQLAEDGQVEQIFEVNAPVSGSIVDWFAIKGEKVDAKSKVVTLGGINRVPVIISLFEGQGAWINRGQKIVVRVPTLPGVEFEGQVDRTDREINFSTRTLPVYAGFTTPDPRIRYGMLVDVIIQAAARENVLRIPREALILTGEGSRVIIDRGNGRFLPVMVKPGIESGDYIEILSGLKQGQEVVISGQFLIDSESSLKADFQRMEMADENK